MSSRYGTDRDPYQYKGTKVLKNKLYTRNESLLESAERDFTTTRIFQLKEEPLRGRLNFAYLKNIHRFVFQDIYFWAGNVRILEISKGSTHFCRAIYIDSQARAIFGNLSDENYL